MTTSTNKTVIEGSMKGGVAKATSVTLAGVLAVGMVPAAAFAAGAEDVESNDGISTLLAGDAFSGGTVTAAAQWATGSDQAAATQTTGVTIQATGEPLNVVPTQVTPFGANPETVATVVKVGETPAGSTDAATANSYTMAEGYTLTYYTADAQGNKGEQVNQVIYPGKYLAVVTAEKGTYAGGEIALPFTVTPATFENLTVYEVNPENATDYTDEDFVYTGAPLNLGVVQKDASGSNPVYTPLVEGQYSVKWLKAGSLASAPGVEVLDADTYYAVVTGSGIYAGQQVTLASVDVAKFDLANATVEYPKFVTGDYPTTPTSVTVGTGTTKATLAKPELVKLYMADSQSANHGVWGNVGVYNLEATSVTPRDANFVQDSGETAPKTGLTITKVSTLASFKYNNAALADTTINVADGDAAYDTTKITAWNGTKKLENATNALTVTVERLTGTATAGKTPAEDLADNVPGKYQVTVQAAADANYDVAGYQTITVTVLAGSVNADTSLYVAYKGKGVTSITTTYNGSGANNGITSGDITWNIKDANGTPAFGTNQTGASAGVTVTNAAGEKIGFPLTEAGTYTVTFNPANYVVTGVNTLPITINKLDLTAGNIILSKNASTITETDLGYTSTPTGYKWFDTTNDIDSLPTNVFVKDADGAVEYDDVDYSAVDGTLTKVTWEMYDAEKDQWKVVTSIPQDAQTQVRAIVKAANKDASGNYVFSDAAENQTVLTFETAPYAKLKFADVLPGEWFFNPVYKADKLQYMTGYEGQGLFGPYDKLTRGQAACILYNMSGDDHILGSEGGVIGDAATGYVSFDDVNPKAYYAKAVAWAKASGVVNGFAGTDNFGPEQTVTREQFACMLWNYAKAVKSTTVAGVDVAATLAAAKDGASVSDWAKDGVAWAVSAKVMGNNDGIINPLAKVNRAEAAAMAVNYQPTKLV